MPYTPSPRRLTERGDLILSGCVLLGCAAFVLACWWWGQ